MHSFFLFVALLAASLIVASAVTYPAWLLVGTISIEPVHRVMNRVAMLLALIGLVVLTRRLGLSNREATGYGLPRAQFVRQVILGWLAGLALMAPLVALLLSFGIRELKHEFEGDWLTLLVSAVLSGFAVAFIEETFFRGVLFSAVRRTSSVAAAVIAPSVLYAALHFLGGRLRVPADEVSWHHGFVVLSRLFERYTQPLTFVDSFLALLMLGMLLALIRVRTGAIAACIGLHAAGVCTIAILREATAVDTTAAHAEWAGTYDGVIGWAALMWFAIIGIAIGYYSRNREREKAIGDRR